MKSKLVCAALAAFALLLSSDGALAGHGCASGEHIKQQLCLGGVGVVVRDRSGAIVGRGETDADGATRIIVVVGDFDGDGVDEYTLEIDGESFVKAVDRLDLDKPVQKPGGPSVTLGVGGFLGGGGHGRSNHEGHGGSHSGGGVGLGVSIPLGGGHDDEPDAPAGYPITGITISLPANPDANIADSGTSLTFKAPYCRDAALRGLSLTFTPPPPSPQKAFLGRNALLILLGLRIESAAGNAR